MARTFTFFVLSAFSMNLKKRTLCQDWLAQAASLSVSQQNDFIISFNHSNDRKHFYPIKTNTSIKGSFTRSVIKYENKRKIKLFGIGKNIV